VAFTVCNFVPKIKLLKSYASIYFPPDHNMHTLLLAKRSEAKNLIRYQLISVSIVLWNFSSYLVIVRLKALNMNKIEKIAIPHKERSLPRGLDIWGG